MINTEVRNKVGLIYLDSPETLNAINGQMVDEIYEALKKFEEDKEIRAILFDSHAEKGLSAGGDLKEIYYNYLTNDEAPKKEEFFKKEFDLNKYIMDYPKPIISHWFGITMGGGIGLTIHSDLIIADETTNWAMPETSLGFVPDVSVGYYISRLDRALGQYVGLIGSRLYPIDLVKNDLAHILINHKDYQEILEIIVRLSETSEDLIRDIKNEISGFAIKEGTSPNIENEAKIKTHFAKDSVEEIVASLKEADDDFARESLEVLESRDPFMVKVQFEKYFLGKKLTRKETIDLDLDIIRYGLKTGAIKEGIRAKLIDKDNEAVWPVSSLADVDEKEVKNLLRIK
ncbi:enoyl-CoA hydratase/isomerase family protein [Anaerococcus kampingiae]|uniref:3-hydroxyisobutyryl-CoA hydrolase n=1 Tax=Anaerococcus kampingae TaxID=3115614 RepID=A0ABW9MD57_9FIRM|nr:enoyl-CoA hydratase/isomerase family protein [uncultured Anaerococcus sp.]